MNEELVAVWYGGGVKRCCLGLESLSLSSISLASPMAWAIE